MSDDVKGDDVGESRLEEKEISLRELQQIMERGGELYLLSEIDYLSNAGFKILKWRKITEVTP